MSMSPKAAYVTLLTKTAYLPGTLVLELTLRSVNSRYPLVVMVTPALPQEARDVLNRKGIAMVEVNRLMPEERVHKLAPHDARFHDTWTKLRGFEMVDYGRIVLLDSDMIVMRNMDELMDLSLPKDWIAAAHVCACNPRKFPHYPADWIPENCAHTSVVPNPTGITSPPAITDSSPRPYTLLNSGLVVLNPSLELANAITHYLSTSPLVPGFSFPDQDLLAAFFKGRWKPLPWCYNALKTLRIIHKPLWRDEEVRCLHYILPDKPWHTRPKEKGTGGEYEEVTRWWWVRYDKLGEEMKNADSSGWELVEANVEKA